MTPRSSFQERQALSRPCKTPGLNVPNDLYILSQREDPYMGGSRLKKLTIRPKRECRANN